MAQDNNNNNNDNLTPEQQEIIKKIEAEEEADWNGPTKEFFNSITKALSAVCIAQNTVDKNIDKPTLPLTMRPYDVVFAVMGSDNLKAKQKEVLNSEEFPNMYNKFVKGVKKGIKMGGNK